MTVADFVRENRTEIDAAIQRVVDNPGFEIDDDERELWIANDEGLYDWARSEGVDFDE
jgi:hypothetical protein